MDNVDYDLEAYLNSMDDSIYTAIEKEKLENEQRFSNARQANRLDDGIKEIEEEFLSFLPAIEEEDEPLLEVAPAEESIKVAYREYEEKLFSNIGIDEGDRYETIPSIPCKELVEDIRNKPKDIQNIPDYSMPCSNLVKTIRQRERPIMPCENLVNSIRKSIE